jgi:hypothetical protein
MLGGGRRYFDALLDKSGERRALGYDPTELLAQLLEVSFASYRALLALGGAKEIPKQINVPRPAKPGSPGGASSKPAPVNWRVLASRLGVSRG